MDNSPHGPQPFRYSIPDPHAFDPLQESLWKSVKAALFLAALYALTLAPLVFYPLSILTPSVNLQNFNHVVGAITILYGSWLLVSVPAMMIGGTGALFIAVLSGSLMGVLYKYGVKERLPHHQAWWCGFWISLLFLGFRLGVGMMVVKGWHSDAWLAWYVPNLIAFFAFWWVGYRVNQQMPNP